MNIITDTDALAALCARMATADFVAVDTEFMRESTYWPVLCLIQAAAGEDEAIIDPMAEGLDLAPFLALMNNSAVLKVFHAARQDLEIFHHLSGAVPQPIFDSQPAAAAVGLGDSIAYDSLIRALLKRSVDKTSRFTDWSRRPLSERQLAYALSDVTHLRDAFPKLRRRLEEAGRADWVAEEMAVLSDPATYALNPDEAWRRLKLRKTTPAYLAVLKAAAAWREREAQSRDVPRNRVLKDDGVYEIALQRPDSAEALGRLRAVPNGFERSRAGRALVEAIAPAIAAPDAHAPAITKPPPPPPGAGPTVELLKVLLRLKAEEHGVAARLIATVADLERIAADDAAEVPALAGWRRMVFGDAALALKRGEIALMLKRDRVVAEPLPA
ncbi:MAG: ribonuclease D [Caulobacterales bacterium]|nr:ribonuclease D [Caulobacterales bacterium]